MISRHDPILDSSHDGNEDWAIINQALKDSGITVHPRLTMKCGDFSAAFVCEGEIKTEEDFIETLENIIKFLKAPRVEEDRDL